MEQAIGIVGLVQSGAAQENFIGIPVFADYDAISSPFDAF